MLKVIGNTVTEIVAEQVITVSTKKHVWKLTLPLAERVAQTIFIKNADPIKFGSRRKREDKLRITSNLIESVFKAHENGSPNVKKRLEEFLMTSICTPYATMPETKLFREKYGISPPSFLTISPYGGCNLKCKGCYAASAPLDMPFLSADTFQWVLDQKRKDWGSWFTVVSGGEPFLWHDGDVDLIEIAARNPEQYFLVYSNGTQIDKATAARLGEAGNITLAISVEGFEKETDWRRGKGTFKKILTAFDNLRNSGVPFGISTTAVPGNAKLVLSDEMVKFFFEEQGVLYQWLFQYMPIGRGVDTTRQISPELRKWMWKREQELIYDRHLFLADFWNGGPFSSGCIAGARKEGYMYIDWNGNIYPCVFVPYWKDNIHTLKSSGKPLSDAIFSDLFKGVRDWQCSYNYLKPPRECGNEIRPCFIRDHHDKARNVILGTNATPSSSSAEQSLTDNDYISSMREYDLGLAEQLDPIWEEYYREE